MTMTSVSGSSNTAAAPIRSNTELMKREKADSEEKASEKAAAAQKDDEDRSKKAVAAERMEEAKGVKEVDTKA